MAPAAPQGDRRARSEVVPVAISMMTVADHRRSGDNFRRGSEPRKDGKWLVHMVTARRVLARSAPRAARSCPGPGARTPVLPVFATAVLATAVLATATAVLATPR
ncbi:MAG TPA: hypothetical protein VFQ44_30670 [Streptosporangiaceae bacterium]|nr:hypothetical protein [Streptosporangiaceae bacterium]